LDSDEGTEQSAKPKKHEEHLFLETMNGNIRSSRKPSTPKVEEVYCKEATQSRPLTHSQNHQAQNTLEHTEVKQRRAWKKKRGNK